MDGGNNIDARLASIQGGVDLANERLQHANRLADERHESLKGEISDIRRVQHKHGNDIGNLQAAEHKRQGERQGLATGGRFAWAFVGFIPGSVIALLKLFGI